MGGGTARGGEWAWGARQTKPSSWFLPDAPSSKGRPWSVRRPHRYPGSRNSLMTPDGGLSGVQPSLCHPALPRVGPKPSDLHFQVEHVRGPDPRPVSHLPAPPGAGGGGPPSQQPTSPGSAVDSAPCRPPVPPHPGGPSSSPPVRNSTKSRVFPPSCFSASSACRFPWTPPQPSLRPLTMWLSSHPAPSAQPPAAPRPPF